MNDINIELYQTMYLIRMSEEKIRDHYPSDKIKTPVHLSIGQEAIVAGVISKLKSTDQVLVPTEVTVYISPKVETPIISLENYSEKKQASSEAKLDRCISALLGVVSWVPQQLSEQQFLLP